MRCPRCNGTVAHFVRCLSVPEHFSCVNCGWYDEPSVVVVGAVDPAFKKQIKSLMAMTPHEIRIHKRTQQRRFNARMKAARCSV